MSDIQQYLLDFDKNKKEATATAQRSATRMYADIQLPHPRGMRRAGAGAWSC
jgi:hypothetical protein